MTDHLAAPHHGDAVRDLEHFAQLVADEDDRLAALDQAPEDGKELFGLLRRQDSGRLVKDEDVGSAIQDLDDLGPLLQADRQVASSRIRVKDESVLARELGDFLFRFRMIVKTAGRHRLAAQHHVLADREDRDEHEVLVHHADALRDSVARAADACRLAVDQDLAGIRMDEPVEDVHQGALARSVLSDEGMDLAGADREVDVIVGDHAGPGLGDAVHLEGERFGCRCAHSVPGEYGTPSAAGGTLRPTMPASTIRVRMYGSMLRKYGDTWMIELLS